MPPSLPFIEQWGSCCVLISALNYLRYLGIPTVTPQDPEWMDYVRSYLCEAGAVIRVDQVWADHGIERTKCYHNQPVPPFELGHWDWSTGLHSSLVIEENSLGQWKIVNRSGKRFPLVQTIWPWELRPTQLKFSELTYVGDWRVT